MSLRELLRRPLLADLEPYTRSGGPSLVYTALLLAGAVLLFPFGLAVQGAVDPAALAEWAEGSNVFLSITLVLLAMLPLPAALVGLHRAARDAWAGTVAAVTAGAGGLALWIAGAPYWTLYLRGQWLPLRGDPDLDARLAGSFAGWVDLAPLALVLFWAGASMLCEAVFGRTGRGAVLGRVLAVAIGIAALGPFVAPAAPGAAVAMMLAGCVALAVLGVRVTADARRVAPGAPAAPTSG